MSVIKTESASFSLTKASQDAIRTSAPLLVAAEVIASPVEVARNLHGYNGYFTSVGAPSLSMTEWFLHPKLLPQQLPPSFAFPPMVWGGTRPFMQPTCFHDPDDSMIPFMYGIPAYSGSKIEGRSHVDLGEKFPGQLWQVSAGLPPYYDQLYAHVDASSRAVHEATGMRSFTVNELAQVNAVAQGGMQAFPDREHPSSTAPYYCPPLFVGSPAVSSPISQVARLPPLEPGCKKRRKEQDPSKPRRKMKLHYNCRECGEPKKGHICPFNLKY